MVIPWERVRANLGLLWCNEGHTDQEVIGFLEQLGVEVTGYVTPEPVAPRRTSFDDLIQGVYDPIIRDNLTTMPIRRAGRA